MQSPDWVRVSLIATGVAGTTEPMRQPDATQWIETMQFIYPRVRYEIMPCELDWAELSSADGHGPVTH